MRAVRLATEGFRNLEPFELATDAQFVVFHGDNAQGKTNALEAVYWAATLKPLRGKKLKELVGWEASSAHVALDVVHEGLLRRYRVDYEGERQIRVDGKTPRELSDYFTGVRAIAFAPSDAAIVDGEPSIRRAWVDRATFTRQPAYLGLVRAYRRALGHKAAALKGPTDPALLDVYDLQLAELGAKVAERRAVLLDDLGPHVREVHRTIAGRKEELGLRMRTKALGDSHEVRKNALLEAMSESRELDQRRGFTLVGPHTDELVISLDGKALRTFGSRGQVRSLVLSLKLAELLAAKAAGVTPLFLLDDVSSELDRARTARLVQVLAELGAQVWASTTAPEHIEGLPVGDTVAVRVEKGRLDVS
ncbi:MAG: DNA replication and repair protein RecF [Deltaproteobacteria bacterium]|nr:MAG: DNA replication and repair protein RecF [Deltaproteobacteria bacterium]